MSITLLTDWFVKLKTWSKDVYKRQLIYGEETLIVLGKNFLLQLFPCERLHLCLLYTS